MTKYLNSVDGGGYWFLVIFIIVVITINGIQTSPIISEFQNNNNNNPLNPDIRVRRDALTPSQILSGLPVPIDLQTVQRIIQILTSVGQQIFNPTRMLAGISSTNSDDDYGSGGSKSIGGPFQLLTRLNSPFNKS